MRNICVGNLDFDTTVDELRKPFENYGAVENVHVVRDRNTGQSRGFAFVEMMSTEFGRRKANWSP
jgi:RNA recognition motif-containing protein